ncbi:MAG: hypothetical protein J0H93_08390 [Chlamydiales bacterium]|nr:hypothetical protein [Chlamydiales bacterium]
MLKKALYACVLLSCATLFTSHLYTLLACDRCPDRGNLACDKCRVSSEALFSCEGHPDHDHDHDHDHIMA